MIVRTLDEITGHRARRARRRLARAPATSCATTASASRCRRRPSTAAREMQLWYKHHHEACFVIEGEAELTERDTGAVHRIGPGIGVRAEHDRHTIRVLEPLRLVCVFNPALTGRETHDADGSYLPAGRLGRDDLDRRAEVRAGVAGADPVVARLGAPPGSARGPGRAADADVLDRHGLGVCRPPGLVPAGPRSVRGQVEARRSQPLVDRCIERRTGSRASSPPGR